MSKPWSSAPLVYSGDDRHSFGMTRQVQPKTAPDRGPWPWDRTADGKLDEAAYGKIRTPRRFYSTRPGSRTSCYADWILAKGSGSSFTAQDAAATLGVPTDAGRAAVHNALVTLENKGLVQIKSPRFGHQPTVWEVV